MANRDQEREALREQRRQAETDAEGQARRQRLVKLISAAVFLAIIAVAIAIVVSQSGGDGGGDSDIAGAAEINKQLRGLPQQGAVVGDPDAEVTLIEFGDPQCPACAAYAEEVIPQLLEGPIRSGDANLEFQPWIIIGEDSVPAAEAAYAAGEQGRFWNFIDLFYRNQGAENSGYIDDDFLTAVAEGAGVPDIERWNEDREDPRWRRELKRNELDADLLGFSGTPSFAIESNRTLLAKPISSPGGIPQLPDLLAAIRQAD